MKTQNLHENRAASLTEMADRLNHILVRQEETVLNLIGLEERKTDAVIAREVLALQSLTKDQETGIRDLNRLEEERVVLIREMSDLACIPEIESMSGIGQLPISEEQKSGLINTGYALRELMSTLRTRSDSNAILISDHIDLFRQLVQMFRETEDSGYGDKPEAPRHKALFIDTRG